MKKVWTGLECKSIGWSGNGIGRYGQKRLVLIEAAILLMFAVLFFRSAVYTEAAVRWPEERVSYATGTRGEEAAGIEYDTSRAGEGIVCVHVKADGEYAVLLTHEGSIYSYVNLPAGEVVLPLNMGEGTYGLITAVRVSGTKHRVLEEGRFEAHFSDETIPFLTANYMVNYPEEANFSGVAQALNGAGDELTVMSAVCDWVWRNVSYDQDKERLLLTNNTGISRNIPSPEETYSSRRGICLDLAALTVAMLRTDGISARLIFGMYNGRYHAWAQAFSHVNGWITVDPTSHYVGKGIGYSMQRMY